MVSAKKPELSNGSIKHKNQQNMSFQGKGMAAGGANKGDGKPQNGTLPNALHNGLMLTMAGNVGGFRTDAAISGSRNQGERTLQRWVPDAREEADGSLESSRSGQDGAPWDQFAENERRFGLKTDYRDEIYTTAINTNHPDYKQRLAAADRKAREIERSTASNSHVQEERITDNLSKDDNGDEEDKSATLAHIAISLTNICADTAEFVDSKTSLRSPLPTTNILHPLDELQLVSQQ